MADLSALLAASTAYFADEPAAVSLVAELGDRFVAIRRGDDGAALPVGKYPTEAAALSALEADRDRRALAATMAAFEVHEAEHGDDLDVDCSICRIDAGLLGIALPPAAGGAK